MSVVLTLVSGCVPHRGLFSLYTAAQEVTTPFTWVDLVTEEMYQVLEAENTLSARCGTSPQRDECTHVAMQPRRFSWPVHAEPSDESPELGRIIMLVSPGKGIEAQWQANTNLESVPFEPDDATLDWGYGSPFLVTALDIRGEWALLPRGPFAAPVWLNLRIVSPTVRTVGIMEFGIVELDGRSLVVILVDSGELVVRDEMPFDMPCNRSEQGVPENLTSFRLKQSDVYDTNLHLRVVEKYKKGC